MRPPTDPDDDNSVVEGLNDTDIEREDEESNKGDRENVDEEAGADHLNQDIWNEPPVLAQLTPININQSPPLPHSSPIPSLDALAPPCLPCEEGGEPQPGPQRGPPNCMGLPPPLSATTITASAPTCTLKVSESTSEVDKQFAASEKRIKELEHKVKRIKDLECEVERLGTYCVLSRGLITWLQKQVNTKEKKKKTAAHAKKSTGEARVLTSKEGHKELQQLHEESHQKELHQINKLAQKAAENLAQCKHRADLTHIFTGLLNKSWHKEELADIAATLLLLDSGKKNDIFERIMTEFNENTGLKTSPCFEGLFHLHP